jgi:hypothetical protein
MCRPNFVNWNIRFHYGFGNISFFLSRKSKSGGGEHSTTVTSLPAKGVTVYARLYSYLNGSWQYQDYTYVEASN